MVNHPDEVSSVGFTGTQRGMSQKQLVEVNKLLTTTFTNLKFVHHGDCVGADDEFDTIARLRSLEIHCHPPTVKRKRAFVEDKGPTVIYPVEPYLTRNRIIVRSGDLLIATPYEHEEQLRSGTWSTVRYALQLHVPTLLVFPNGELHWITLESFR